MRTFARLALTIVITMIITIGFATAAGTEEQGLHEFWTLDLEGQETTQQIFAPYELTMINVWATYCSPCLEEMPALAQLQKEFAPKGVNIIGIVSDVNFSNEEAFAKSIGTAKYIIQETGADYTHLLPSEDLYNLRLKDVQVVPETFFVDNKGNIVGETYYGARDTKTWRGIMESTLADLD
jgi:thiol-disulfide isomerase/thioredoxin